MGRYLFTLILFLAAGLQSRAGRSSVSGHISSASGKPLDSVMVKLTADGGWQFSIAADANGYFSITGLSAKTYVATISRRGYESRRIIGIGIDSGKAAHLSLDAALSPMHRKDARITTLVYRKKSASPLDPGHWVAGKPDSKPAGIQARGSAGMSGSTAMQPTDIGKMPSSGGNAALVIDPPGAGAMSVRPATAPHSARPATIAANVSSGAVQVAPEAAAGSLTSGEINDFAKWNLWEDVSYKTLQEYRKTWAIGPEKRISVLVKAANGAPLANASVTLLEVGKTIWEGRTDNTGKAELWYELFGKEQEYNYPLSVRVRVGSVSQLIHGIGLFDEGINVVQTGFPCSNTRKVDVAFLVDATGSMGDEIGYLKTELRDILQRVTDSMPLAHVQTGAVFYRDRSDDYLVRSSALSDSFGLTAAFIAEAEAHGGGDGPEAVESALAAGLELGWREDATARLAFLILDAPPHSDSTTFKAMQTLIRTYASRGIRLIPIACSGSDKPTEYLLRAIALATNGTYLFLTDHSGLGESHPAPTTDTFNVEYLNSLISRVIRSFSTMPECEPGLLADVPAPVQRDSVSTAWQIYPNPTQDVLHVVHNQKTGYLYVTDIRGKLVQRIAVDPGGHSHIDMRRYPAGMYSLRHSWSSDKDVASTFTVTR